MTQPIDQSFHLNDAYDPAFATFDGVDLPVAADLLRIGQEYVAVEARPTVHDGLIETEAGTRAVVWDLAIDTPEGRIWLPDTMLDPPYSDI